MSNAKDTISKVVGETQMYGIETDHLILDPALRLAAILVATESGAVYLFESTEKHHRLITRLAEFSPYLGEFRLPNSFTIVRREGILDKELFVGRSADVYGL